MNLFTRKSQSRAAKNAKQKRSMTEKKMNTTARDAFEKMGFTEIRDDGYMYEYRGNKVHQMHTKYTDGKTGSIKETKCRGCLNTLFWDSKSEELYCPACKGNYE